MDNARQLILAAYERARMSGKANWYRMTTSVLKNRLLDLTGRQFDEQAHGASTIAEFVKQHEDIVSLDESTSPPTVEWRSAERTNQEADSYRIREDLWRAAIDYASGTTYVWDTIAQRARPETANDCAPPITTVSQEKQREWRLSFAQDVSSGLGPTESEEAQIDAWVHHQLGTYRLPGRLRQPWNHTFKARVLDHLRVFFKEIDQPPPDDLRSISEPPSSDADSLRAFIMGVVGRMTEDELAQLSLPAGAIIRGKRR